MIKTITYNNVHNLFKLNGYHLDRGDLCRIAYSFIKEGEAYEKGIGDFILDWFDAKSYVKIKTSGTTGSSKKIKIDKQAMVDSAIATGDFFELSPGNKALHCLPIDYIAGKLMIVRALILGLDMDFVAPTSHPKFSKNIVYDFAAMVPLQVQNSLIELAQVKKLIIGGAKINKVLEKELCQVKTHVFETYGMTETITHIAAKRVGEEAFSLLPNIKISQDERNCLVIHAPKIAAEAIVTNDLVTLINEKQFLFLGRIDNIVNSGGIKLSPEKIEDKLSEKIHSRYFVAGIPDADLGEKLILLIEGEKHEISTSVFEDLDKYEQPKAIFFIEKFLETENGKIKRKEILASL